MEQRHDATDEQNACAKLVGERVSKLWDGLAKDKRPALDDIGAWVYREYEAAIKAMEAEGRTLPDACRTCRSFMPRQEAADGGFCRRYPPHPQDIRGSDCCESIVMPYDYCGEHKPKPKTLAELQAAMDESTRQWLAAGGSK